MSAAKSPIPNPTMTNLSVSMIGGLVSIDEHTCVETGGTNFLMRFWYLMQNSENSGFRDLIAARYRSLSRSSFCFVLNANSSF